MKASRGGRATRAAAIRAVVKRTIGLLPPRLGLPLAESFRWLGSTSMRERHRRTKSILASIGDPKRVVSGLFEGMAYPIRFGAQGGLLPKLLGTYERELHDAIRVIVDGQPSTVVDIGAAEGFYAVGFARLLPRAKVVAFELEPPYHHAIRLLARESSVAARVEILGRCTPEALTAVLSRERHPVALLSDCEGFEAELLDPHRVPLLRDVVILCEVHDAIRPGTSGVLLSRFSATHQILSIPTAMRGADDVPGHVDLAPGDVAFALSEGRNHAMEWLFMWPLSLPKPDAWSGVAASRRSPVQRTTQ